MELDPEDIAETLNQLFNYLGMTYLGIARQTKENSDGTR